MIAKNDEKMKENIVNIKYVIKWKHIEEKEWHDLVKPKVYKSLKEAFRVLRELEEEENGFFVYQIFEVVE